MAVEGPALGHRLHSVHVRSSEHDRAQRGWIQPDEFEFSDIVGQYRNFVHPRVQQKRGITPDADTVLMCWQPVLAVVNDLDERLPGRQRASGARL
ncbi:MAG: hypothetical protein ACRDQU_06985 [Pseudonocardiaceae bacterium]